MASIGGIGRRTKRALRAGYLVLRYGSEPVRRPKKTPIEKRKISDGEFKYQFRTTSSKRSKRIKRMLIKEKGTIAWLEGELRPDDVFYDIGANVGLYTVFAAKRLPAGTVVAFEPHIPNAARILENLQLNHVVERVQIVTAAVAADNRCDYFNYLDVNPSSSASQFGVLVANGQAFTPILREFKCGLTIDLLCSFGLPKPTLIKIDVDGLERDVLQGMRGLLGSPDRPRSIQVELRVEGRDAIVGLMAEVGYRLVNRHWTQSSEMQIEAGSNPEDCEYNGVFSP